MTTGNLNSGKAEAKANRKNLNRRAEALALKVEELAKLCTQMTEGIGDGDVAAGREGAKKMLVDLNVAR